MADNEYVTALYNTLLQSLGQGPSGPDTNAIKEATKQLNDSFYKNAQAVQGLYQITSQGEQHQVRQIAAVELRKRILGKNKNWTRVDADTRQQLKAGLLDRAINEQDQLVRHSISRVIAAIGQIEIPENQWPDLFSWLWQAAASENATARELAIFTIFALIDTLADVEAFSSQLPQLLELFGRTVRDPESLPVRITTVRALGRTAEYIGMEDKDNIQTYQSLVPAIVSVTQEAVTDGDQEGVTHCFDCIETIAFCEAPLITPVLGDLVHFLLQIGGNKEADEDMRLPGLSNLLLLIKYKKHRIQSLGLASSIIEPLFNIAAEEEPEDFSDDCPARTALRCIDALANNLPPSHVVDPVITLCQKYSNSQDQMMRKAAIASLGMTFEGCSFYIEPHLQELWPFVEQCLKDPSPIVRQSACVTLGFVCDVLGESAAKHHVSLLPIVFELLNDQLTQRNALSALDSLLENLDDQSIVPYLPTLMERLLGLVPNVQDQLKGTVVGAIGSAAHASKSKFEPYFEQTMQLLSPLLVLKGQDEEIAVRGVAQDTVGTLAEAVGKEKFRPYYGDIMQNALEAVTLNVPNLRECSFIFFTAMSRVYKEEFAQYLGTIMPLILASLSQNEIGSDTEFNFTANGFQPDGQNITATEGNDDDEEFEDVDDDENFPNVSSDITLEKEVAVDALSEFFENTREHFLPYINQAVTALLSLTGHFYEGIRSSAMSSMFRFIVTANSMANPEKYTPGLNPTPLDKHVKELVDSVLPEVLQAWETEDDREVVQGICEGLGNTILAVGPALIVPDYLDGICEKALAILENRAPCQVLSDDEGDAPQPQEKSEWDIYLIRSSSELVGAIARALGSDFARALPTFLPSIVSLTDSKRADSQPGERSNAIGVLSDIVDGMKDGITPFTNDFAQVFLQSLQDSELDVRGTAAYAFGLLVQRSNADLSSHYMSFLEQIQHILENPGTSSDANQARDNASGAIARLIQKNSASVPIDQILPRLLNQLPIKEDDREIEPVVRSLVQLLQEQNATAVQEIDRILSILQSALAKQAEATNPEAVSSADKKDASDRPLTQEALEQVVSFTRTLPADKVQSSGLAPFIS